MKDISYTLNVGRNHFDKRCALVVSSVEELKETLQQIKENKKITNVFISIEKKESIDDQAIFDELFKQLTHAISQYNQLTTQEYQNKLRALANFYVKGYDLEWERLHEGEAKRRVALPTYPFAKERHWISLEKTVRSVSAIASLHPLLDANVSTFEHPYSLNKIFNVDEFYLNDHRVQGVRVLPGVAYLEMARAAGSIISPNDLVVSISNILWVKPITIQENAVEEINIQLHRTDQGVTFEVVSRNNAHAEPIVHAQGKLHFASGHALASQVFPSLDIPTIQSRCIRTFSREDIYTAFATQGLQYGASFQVIETLGCGEKEALAKLKLPMLQQKEFAQWMLHPSLLDGALQTVVGFFHQKEDITLHLPFSLGRIDIIKKLSEEVYVYAEKLTSPKNTEQNGLQKFKIQLLDKLGNVLVQLMEFTVRVLQVDVPLSSQKEIRTFYYQPAWERAEITASDKTLTLQEPVWLINLSDKLEYVGSALQKHFSDEALAVYLTLEKSSDIQDLLERKGLPRYVIFMDEIEEKITVDIATDLRERFFSLFQFIQILLRAQPRKPIDCVYSYVLKGNTLNSFAEAFSGFWKTLSQEQPFVRGRTLGIEKSNLDDLYHFKKILIQSLINAEKEVCYYDNIRWVKRFFEVSFSSDSVSHSLFKNNGVYLITGGLGGLGIIFARFLAKKYKAQLILIGRSQLEEKQRAILSQLEKEGAKMYYFAANVADKFQLEEVIEKAKKHVKKINGVIHSAGVVHDGLILKKTTADILEVLEPKILGTLNLDAVTLNEPLDFFVMFSSVASIVGNIGQCDYAYANGFMDSFAKKREEYRNNNKRQGKTLSINWPLWAKGGMQVNAEIKKWISQTSGIKALKIKEGLIAFSTVLQYANLQALVITGEKKKFSKILNVSSSSMPSRERSITPSTNNIDLISKINEQVLKIASDLLKIKIENLDVDQELNEYGMDSINLIAFLNRINSYYRIQLTPDVLFNQTTLNSFSHYLVENYKTTLEQHYSGFAPTNQIKPSVSSKIIHVEFSSPKVPKTQEKQPTVYAEPEQILSQPLRSNRILLTGSTGVLGGYLVKLILQESDRELSCLVRAETVVAAKMKLKEILKAYASGEKILSYVDTKIHIFLGDIIQPRLGLSLKEYEELAERTDLVIHCAGSVSLHGIYEALVPTNVTGTKHIIDFTLMTQQKYFLYVSSYSVMGDIFLKKHSPFKETDFDLGQGFNNMGYQQTKFVAERLVRDSKEQGIHWVIVRPGNIFGEGQRGCYPLHIPHLKGIFYDILKTVIDTGVGLNSALYFDMTPVDYVARGILYLGSQHPAIYGTYHLNNPSPKRFVHILEYIKQIGYPIEIVNFDEYMKRLRENQLFKNQKLYRSRTTDLFLANSSILYTKASTRTDATLTYSILKAAGITCPKLDRNLIKTYLIFCEEIGYFSEEELDILA